MKKLIKNQLFKNWILISVTVCFLVFLIGGNNNKRSDDKYVLPIAKASISDNVAGYAWSDNIGWISFNCSDTSDNCNTSTYGVNIGGDKKMSGYAWGDNIGWISFNESDLGGCPSGVCKARLSGVEIIGWARALSGMDFDDGWDGWISLSKKPSGSINYGIVLNEETLDFEGYAWGGEIVGWIDFNPNYGGVIFTGNFPLITPGTFQIDSVVTGNKTYANWETEYVVSCNLVSDTGYEDLDLCHNVNQCATIIDLLVDKEVMEETTYTLTCFNNVGMSVTEIYTPTKYFELNGNPSEVIIDFVGGGATSTPTEIGIVSWNGFKDNVSFSADLSGLPESPGDETTNLAIFSRLTLTFADYFTNGVISILEIFASDRFIGERSIPVWGNNFESTNITINAGNIEPVYEEI